MKRFILIITFLALLTACGSMPTEDESALTISQEQRERYTADIDNELQLAHWTYGTLHYAAGDIVSKDNPNYDAIYQASLATGYDITGKEGQKAVIASTSLTHFNNSLAGEAYFYYVEDSLVCEYYEYNGAVYPLTQRSVYETAGAITRFENTQTEVEFDKHSLDIAFDNCSAVSNDDKIAVIDEHKISTLSYKKSFVVESTIDFTAENLYPIDATFAEDNTLVVLLGKQDEGYSASDEPAGEHEHSEEEYEDVLCEGETPLKSVSIAFIQGGSVQNRLELNLSNYTAIAINGEELFVTRDKSLDIYSKDATGQWEKIQQATLKHWVSQLEIADIDGDGVNEYIMSDNTDIYVYHLDSTLEMVWRTYMSLSTIKSRLYIGDLNQDGVKEIYVEDDAGITLRYVFGEKSANIYNGNIIANENSHYIVGDFNGDKKDDYVLIDADTDKGSVYLAK